MQADKGCASNANSQRLPMPRLRVLLLECVWIQDSRLARQWSEAVFGRWPQVMHKSGAAVAPACYTVGAGCQICWGLVLTAWIPADDVLSIEWNLDNRVTDSLHFPFDIHFLLSSKSTCLSHFVSTMCWALNHTAWTNTRVIPLITES